MAIKKFDLRGLDTTGNSQVLTTENLASNVVIAGLTAAFPDVFSSATTKAIVTSNTDPATSNVTGALRVAGGAAIQGNLYAGSVYTNGLYFANGTPYESGGASITVSNAAPTSPSVGALWLNSDSGELFVWYWDGDSGQWIAPTGAAGPMGATGPAGSSGAVVYTSNTAPVTSTEGSLWFDSDTGDLLVFYGNGWAGIAGGLSSGGGSGGTGATGATGVAGVNGATGATGAQGSTGATGIGATGATGATGISGNIGATGATGPGYQRNTIAGTTASLANAATGNLDVTGFKGYALYKIQTSVASWVRIYTDQASRSADSARAENTDPGTNSGVIAEVITTGANTIVIAPAAIGFNNEATPTTNIPMAVTNKSGSTGTVTVTLTVVQVE